MSESLTPFSPSLPPPLILSPSPSPPPPSPPPPSPPPPSQGNYKHYRDKLGATELPAVPYVGVFLKDLTFICDGNPDYLRGGLINMHKRRQVWKKTSNSHGGPNLEPGMRSPL